MNKTEDIDFFCVKLFMGPLVWVVFWVPSACVGIPASVSVLWVLIQRQHNGLSNDIYMLSITIMDLIYNISKLPFLLNFFVWQNELIHSLLSMLEGFNLDGRPLLMACICIDCYMAVVFPVPYMKMKQSRYRMVVCVLVWVFTLMFNLLSVFWTSLVPFSIWGVPCLLSISTIIFCDLSILCVLRKPDPSGRTTVHPQKQRALQTITNSFITTIVSYLPIVVVNISKDIIPLGNQEWYCSVFIPVTVFSTLGGTILPLLYLKNLGILKDLMSYFWVRSV